MIRRRRRRREKKLGERKVCLLPVRVCRPCVLCLCRRRRWMVNGKKIASFSSSSFLLAHSHSHYAPLVCVVCGLQAAQLDGSRRPFVVCVSFVRSLALSVSHTFSFHSLESENIRVVVVLVQGKATEWSRSLVIRVASQPTTRTHILEHSQEFACQKHCQIRLEFANERTQSGDGREQKNQLSAHSQTRELEFFQASELRRESNCNRARDRPNDRPTDGEKQREARQGKYNSRADTN